MAGLKEGRVDEKNGRIAEERVGSMKKEDRVKFEQRRKNMTGYWDGGRENYLK